MSDFEQHHEVWHGVPWTAAFDRTCTSQILQSFLQIDSMAQQVMTDCRDKRNFYLQYCKKWQWQCLAAESEVWHGVLGV